VYCSVLQCVAVSRCNVLQCVVAVCCCSVCIGYGVARSRLRKSVEYCSVLHLVAVSCCSESLQCVVRFLHSQLTYENLCQLYQHVTLQNF